MPAFQHPKKLDADGLWEYALRALAQRPHSVAELRNKLSRRAETPEVLHLTLNKLREYDLANDHKFSELFASSRLQNQGFGRMRVLRDLRNKRVSPQIAEQAVEQTFAGTEEPALIEQFLARKYRGETLQVLLADQKGVASVYRRLRLAGYNHANSLDALKRLKADLPEWEDNAEEPA